MSHHATPLRYPGGKQRLAPFVMELLVENQVAGGHYVEPYAGGAGVAIELLLNDHVRHIHLNDVSVPVYCFWNCVVNHPEDLCRRIRSASLSIEEWKRRREIVRCPAGHDELEVGFSAFYLNRCNRSGVLSGGVIGGLRQSGSWKMDARFSRNELIRRIEAIAARSGAVSLSNCDAEKFILEYIPNLPSDAFVYCDPPYFRKSRRLYLNRYDVSDHERIAGVIQDRLPRKWVVSYDAAPEIMRYYSDRRSFCYRLQYNAAQVYQGTEVFIFSDDLALPTSSSLPPIHEALTRRRIAGALPTASPG